MIKKKRIFFFCITLIILIIAFPFLIEKILVNESIFPFNKTIIFSKESWFGFISSYLGAIGTVSLGIIALYQNKKYRELAENSDDKFIKLQEDIKDLTKKSVDLIEINTILLKTKYFPILNEQPGINYDSVEGLFLETDSFQMTIFCGSLEDIHKLAKNEYDYFFEHYHTLTISFKNDSERTIRNFICTPEIGLLKKSQNQVYQEGSVSSWVCDIAPGALVRCVLILKFDLTEEIRSGRIDSLHRKFRMENVLGEKFEMEVNIYFFNDSEIFLDHYIQISPISRIE